MNLSKLLRKFFYGCVVLEEVNSPINGRIQVREDLFGKRSLVVGGISQSGENVERVWRPVIKKLSNQAVKNCLILGLGAGTAAKLVFQTFSGVKITGVEIDPEMIRLGKKYFGLNKIPNLEIKIADAVSSIISHQSSVINYDLILVDLYLGDQVPKGAETEEFLEDVKKYLTDDGLIIFNRLDYGKHQEKTEQFGKKLTKFFTKIEAKKWNMNKLFLCQR